MIDFSTDERILILAAIKYAKAPENELDDEDLEYIDEIEEEIQKQNVFLSRSQLGTIEGFLGPLMDTNQFEQLEISALEDKISAMTDLN